MTDSSDMAMTPPQAAERTSPFTTVTIVGCGLMGGSLALAARAVPGVETVVVTDTDPQARADAHARGVATRVVAEAAEAVAEADLVVLATPVSAMPGLAAEVAGYMNSDAVLTDIGSVKSRLVLEVERKAGDIRYVGGHPMAGSERSGVSAADGTLYQAATWLLTPTEHTDAGALAEVRSFLRLLGARVLEVSPELHDRLVAVASHLPQVVSSVLMAVAEETSRTGGEPVFSVAAGGFRDTTRVAASDPELWVGILSSNRDAVLEAIDAFGTKLLALRQAVAGEEWSALRDVLAQARSARLALPRKGVAGILVDLVIPIPDQPGALGRVTTLLGDAGINIEDLAMRHASEGSRGAMVLAVNGEAEAHRAQRILEANGFPSHVEPR